MTISQSIQVSDATETNRLYIRGNKVYRTMTVYQSDARPRLYHFQWNKEHGWVKYRWEPTA